MKFTETLSEAGFFPEKGIDIFPASPEMGGHPQIGIFQADLPVVVGPVSLPAFRIGITGEEPVEDILLRNGPVEVKDHGQGLTAGINFMRGLRGKKVLFD